VDSVDEAGKGAPPEDAAEQALAAHLYRAGERLRGDDVEGAEREVGSALALRADDMRALNLLGLVRFRAGRYEEALALYHQLVGRAPDDAALRLNLGLVELRMGRHEDAARDLERVVSSEPENQRAQGYLGLALMRSGELGRAREAFRLAGQPDLAKQVEEKMAVSAESHERAVAEMRKIAERGLRQFAEEAQPFAVVDVDAPGADAGGTWQMKVPGSPVPSPDGASRTARVEPLRLESPLTITEFATARLLRPAQLGEPFALAEGGMLVVRIEGRLATRTLGAIASTGHLAFEPLHKRMRGRAVEEQFGAGAEAMFAASGTGLIVVAPRGSRFTALALKDDVLYVREQNLFSFEESLHWENGRVPGAGLAGLQVVQLRGQGRCVLRADRAAFCVKMEPQDTLYVGQEALLGWIGRVVPRQLKGSDGEPTPYVECTGEGALILEEPPPI
jgi:tetratricopeptide (TPR) repeat protein/uncharacterized protein (AIM24 family)